MTQPNTSQPLSELPRRILILEDDPDTRELLAMLCRRLGCDVVTCSHGIEAAAIITAAWHEGNAFCALIFDCALPGFDGFTVAQIVRTGERTGSVPRAQIGFYTAYAGTVDQSTLLVQVEADAYWHKPRDAERLSPLIAEWLGLPTR